MKIQQVDTSKIWAYVNSVTLHFDRFFRKCVAHIP